jgi:hypothetical protein
MVNDGKDDYLINVGANRSHADRARGPIFPGGAWIFVPFLRDKPTQKGQEFPEVTFPYKRVRDGIKCHLDPDWDRLTYGDCCDKASTRPSEPLQEGHSVLGCGTLAQNLSRLLVPKELGA